MRIRPWSSFHPLNSFPLTCEGVLVEAMTKAKDTVSQSDSKLPQLITNGHPKGSGFFKQPGWTMNIVGLFE